MSAFLKELIDTLLTFVIALCAMLLIRRYLAQLIRVKGKSMMNTLKNGDILLCLYYHKRRPPKRGEMVICNYPGRTRLFFKQIRLKSRFVKRVIGIPGDTMEVKEGVFFINGAPEKRPDNCASTARYYRLLTKPLSEEERMLIQDEPAMAEHVDENGDIWVRLGTRKSYVHYTLKADEYFVMGDNRAVSNDSRSVGPISRQMILSRVIFRIGRIPFMKK